jgi:hypothetical protein
MSYVPNPFRVRVAEQQRDTLSFVRSFGAGMLELLPPSLWDRLLVLRSAPGAGKTSLMRLMSAESLCVVHANRRDFRALAAQLEEIGALDTTGPRVIGFVVNLSRDFRALIDLGPPGRSGDVILNKLIDARVIVKYVEAALTTMGLEFPAEAHRLRFAPTHSAEDAVRRLGGPAGDDLLTAARRAESEVLDLVDSLVPVEWEHERGHAKMYSLIALSGSRVEIDGKPLVGRPLVMFDDGHELADVQRELLIRELLNRELTISRWYAERYEALSHDQVLTGGSPRGRDMVELHIEIAARQSGSGRYGTRGRSRNFEKLLIEIGDMRARRDLLTYGAEETPFSELIKVSSDDLDARASEELPRARQTILDELGPIERYQPWISSARVFAEEADTAYEALIRWRELPILVARDRRKPDPSLFDDLPIEREYEESVGSDTRGAARLFLAKELRLPYYAGPDMVATLASRNVEQFLSLAGNLFDQMAATIALRRKPRLTAESQDRVIRQMSKEFWRAIPQRIPYGPDVQALLLAIAKMARANTFMPNAPYAPGVTGTAFNLHERPALLRALKDANHRSSVSRLARALSSAVAHNLLEADSPRSVKGRTWTVLYLNRLLGPEFDLPLTRGGFREQRLSTLAEWVTHPQIDPLELPDTPSMI